MAKKEDLANPFLAAVREGDAEAVGRLLARDPGLAGLAPEGGATPLALAARLGHIEVLRRLLEAGAASRPEHDHPRGPNALMEAAAAGHEEAVALLLEHGVDAALQDREGRTAADYAQQAGHSDLALRLAPVAEVERSVWSGPPTDSAAAGTEPGPER